MTESLVVDYLVNERAFDALLPSQLPKTDLPLFTHFKVITLLYQNATQIGLDFSD